ncbi:phosphohydrolase [Pseudolabrys sp.]|uniref:phosphohydrolase n=1 Tax=Pseudolabrys sp. TaxID=1960880 RepID=UPI003D0BD5BB
MAVDVGSARIGEWMQTYTGKKFWPMDPRPEEIDIIDIGRALSKMCRYGGHSLKFYSVAEHCVLCSRAAPAHLKMTALLHDASEAYLVDVPRPIKPALDNYYKIEANLMQVISKKFGAVWPLPPEVKQIDNAILRDERLAIMAHMDVPSEIWGDAAEGLGVEIECWNPERAFQEFLKECTAANYARLAA